MKTKPLSSTLTISPEMSASLGECEVGETKSVMVDFTVTAMGESGISGTVDAVEYVEPDDEDDEPDDEFERDMESSAKRPKAVSKALKY